MIYGNFLGSEREFSLGMGREWEWKSILPGTGMETGIASREWMGMGIKKPFPQTSSHKRRTLGCKMAWRAYDVTDDILQNVVVLGAVAVGPRSRTSRTLQHHLVEVLRQHLRSSGGSSRPASQRVVVEERHASLHAIVQPSLSSRTLLTLYSAKAIIVPHRIIWHWYTGRWWVGCYIWYSEEGIGRGRSPPRPLLAVPNVTAHSSVALRF